MTATTADLERNRVRRDIETRCLSVLQAANIPLTPTQVARRARVLNAQATRALTQLVDDGKARRIWDEPRDTTAYVPA